MEVEGEGEDGELPFDDEEERLEQQAVVVESHLPPYGIEELGLGIESGDEVEQVDAIEVLLLFDGELVGHGLALLAEEEDGEEDGEDDEGLALAGEEEVVLEEAVVRVVVGAVLDEVECVLPEEVGGLGGEVVVHELGPVGEGNGEDPGGEDGLEHVRVLALQVVQEQRLHQRLGEVDQQGQQPDVRGQPQDYVQALVPVLLVLVQVAHPLRHEVVHLRRHDVVQSQPLHLRLVVVVHPILRQNLSLRVVPRQVRSQHRYPQVHLQPHFPLRQNLDPHLPVLVLPLLAEINPVARVYPYSYLAPTQLLQRSLLEVLPEPYHDTQIVPRRLPSYHILEHRLSQARNVLR